MNKEEKKAEFSDYLFILYKWKRFFILMMFIAAVGSVVYALILPNKYKAKTTFMMPANKDFGLGSLGGLLSGESSALDIGSRLLGVTGTNEDMILGFMVTKTVIDQIAKKYNLYDYYEIKDHIYEDLLKALSEDIHFDANEYGFIDATVINKNPNVAASMANDFVHLADSLNIYFNIQQAKNYREFVEQRYSQTLVDLKNAEENYYEFQKKYGAFDIPEQIKAMVEATSKMEAQVIQGELVLSGIKQKLGSSSIQYIDQNKQLSELKNKRTKLYKGNNKDDFFVSIDDLPDLQLKYIRLFRELEIQNKTLQFVYPIVEQAKIDEKKNMPTILIIDKAFAPTKKYSPKRSFIVIGITFFAFVLVVIIILRSEKVLNRKNSKNPIEKMELTFNNKLAKIFKVLQ